MAPRFKEYGAGAAGWLREGDLLLATILPGSVDVHVVKHAVRNDGACESAEWRTGKHSTFQTESSQMNQHELERFANALQALRHASKDIISMQAECDSVEYESPGRTVLRFWLDGKQVDVFDSNGRFFRDNGIDENFENQFQLAFRNVVTLLPDVL